MKKIFFAFAILATTVASAQVGVGNTDPKATLDVNKPSYVTGEQAGIAVTQQTGAQIVAMTTTGLKAGTLVYATSTSGIIDSLGYWYFNGTTWVKVGGAASTADGSETKVNAGSGIAVTGSGTVASPYVVSQAPLAVTVPTTDNYTVLDTDAIIYRNLTGSGTITFPASLPAGKVFHIANTSGFFDWALSPAPLNAGNTFIAANQSLTVVTVGGGNIIVTTGY